MLSMWPMPIDTACATPVADYAAVVHIVGDWFRSEGLLPCDDWVSDQYGPYIVLTVQAQANLPIDECNLSRSFENFFREYNLRPDTAVRVFPHMLEQYPDPSGCVVYIYATVFL